MKLGSWKLVGISVLLLSAIALPARADTISTFGFSNTPLVGSPGTTVSGSFTYNSATNTISGASISFNGSPVFANLTINLGSQTGDKNTFLFTFTTTVFNPNTGKTDAVSFTVLLNPFNHSILAVGGKIYDPTGQGGGFYTNKLNVPEGGSEFGYMLPSAMAMFGGILLAGKRRLPLRT
jgi:hypothetical protein